ncbi:hypothetical protein [Sorangium sp. So ce204]|uniref:hypothetical protein n=1 Tax=Sorangium sp. So ce204 TaxID=3133288 RepID=UPI003F620DDD
MVLNNTAENFIRAQMNYANLASCRSPSPAPFQQDQSGFSADLANHGVYLQWTLPAALRHAVESPGGALRFPFVPNRWLVVRLYRPASDATAPTAPLVAAWVVVSDAVGTTDGANYLDPTRSAPTPSTLGHRLPISPASPWQEPGGPSAYFLRAISESNPAFSAYQPFNTNVFSIHDDLRTQGLAAGTLSYFVLGWYADSTADPLAAWPAEDFAGLLSTLGWSAAPAPGAAQSLYHGSAVGVPWTPDAGRPLPSAKDSANPRIAIGNTSVDAVVAFMEAAFSEPGVTLPADLTPQEAAELLEAFQYNLLPVLGQPGGADRVRQTIRAQWFGSTAGGNAWTIGDAPARPGDPPRKPIAADELARETAWLADLNAAQAQYDQTARDLIAVQRRLFELWWKQQAAQAYLAEQGRYPWKVTGDQLRAALDPGDPNGLIARARSLRAKLADLGRQIPRATDTVDLDQAIAAFAASKRLPASRALRAIAAPRFWTAPDPVLVLSGTAHTLKIDPDTKLACRWPAQLVTALAVGTGAGGPSFTIRSDQLTKYLPAVPWSGLPQVAPALFAEFFLLDPSNAALVAAAAGVALTRDQLAALAASIAAPAPPGGGVLPAIAPPFPWTQPWQPLFLDWQLTWYPLPFVNAAGAANWSFDGEDFDLAADITPPVPQILQGRSVLTPKPSFEFKARIDQFIRDNPDSLAAKQLKAIEDLVDTVGHWDFLSQALGGVGTQLESWDPAPTAYPPAAALPGGPESMADLVGNQGSVPPNPQLAAARRAVPPSSFEGLRGGQFYVSRLAVVDAFGRTLEIVTDQTAAQTPVLVGAGLQVTRPIVPVNPQGLVQLPPRLLQPSRLNLQFVPTAAGTPIVGWILPDHLDRGLAVYGPDGTLYGELSPVVDADGAPFVDWWPAPDTPYPTLDPLVGTEPQLGGFLVALKAAGPIALAEFVRAVDETLWSVDPLGDRPNTYLSVLVGRLLAIVTATISLELQTEAHRDPAWPYTFADPPPEPLFLGHHFPVQLGQLAAHQDGLLGYFCDGDYDHFNAVHVPGAGPDDPARSSGYLKPIGDGNWIELGFAAAGPGPSRSLTLVMDPRAAVHAQCGLLPVKDISLVPAWVDSALSAMKAAFRVGPVLAEQRRIAPAPDSPAVDSLLLPRPAERDGGGSNWQWRQPATGGAFTDLTLAPVDGGASLPDTPPILRHGVLQRSGGLSLAHPKERAIMLASSSGGPLLSYSLATSPSPLQVSPQSGPPSVAALTIVVSTPLTVNQVTVTQIVITLPIGDPTAPDTADLADDATGITASVSDTTHWQVGPGGASGSFVVRPANGQSGVLSDHGLAVSITGVRVSQLVGNAVVEIVESATADGGAAQPRVFDITVPKFPYGFYVFNFSADVPQIKAGSVVTLTWVGSANTTYTLSYADQTGIDVSKVRRWRSPPLYTSTAFILTASATVQGQTVTTSLNTVVIVASPAILSFCATPDEIDYNQTVTLSWRATDADGVYLLIGQSGRETLPPVSDPAHPKTLKPQYGVIYAMQAFKRSSGQLGDIVSTTYPLALTFNTLEIESFAADPTTVDLAHQTTTLSWAVAHAKSVAYQGQPVAAQGSHVESPTQASTYELDATWVDGTVTRRTVDVAVVRVKVLGVTPTFAVNGGNITVVLDFHVEAATGGTVSGAHMMFNDRIHWYRWGHPQQTGDQSAKGVSTGPDHWQFTLNYSVDPSWTGLPNIGIMIDYHFDGFQPVTVSSFLMMYRGEFSFWNGS